MRNSNVTGQGTILEKRLKPKCLICRRLLGPRHDKYHEKFLAAQSVQAVEGCLVHAMRSITPNMSQPIAKLLRNTSKKEEMTVSALYAGQGEQNRLLTAKSI
jgi:hypothetical protein